MPERRHTWYWGDTVRLTCWETGRFNCHESMTLFGHGISLLFPVMVRSSSASQA
jgi:hypothetical protein